MTHRTHRLRGCAALGGVARRALRVAVLAGSLASAGGIRADAPMAPAATGVKSGSLGQVVVELLALRNDRGHVLSLLFRSKAGYPDDVQKAFARARTEIHQRRAQLVFHGVPPGPFAVVLFHDENDSTKMDKGWFGIPLEGYGVSRNTKVTASGPDFDTTKLTLGPGEQRRIAIHLKY